MDERLQAVDGQGLSNFTELAERIKTLRRNTWDVFVETQIWRERDAKDSNVVNRGTKTRHILQFC